MQKQIALTQNPLEQLLAVLTAIDVSPYSPFLETHIDIKQPAYTQLVAQYQLPLNLDARLARIPQIWDALGKQEQDSLLRDWTRYYQDAIPDSPVDFTCLATIPATEHLLFAKMHTAITRHVDSFSIETPIQNLTNAQLPREHANPFSKTLTTLYIDRQIASIEDTLQRGLYCDRDLLQRLFAYHTALETDATAETANRRIKRLITELCVRTDSDTTYKIAKHVHRIVSDTPISKAKALTFIQHISEEFETVDAIAHNFPRELLAVIPELLHKEFDNTLCYLEMSTLDAVGRRFQAVELKFGDSTRYLIARHKTSDNKTILKLPPGHLLTLPTTHKTSDYKKHVATCFSHNNFLKTCLEINENMAIVSHAGKDITWFLDQRYPNPDAITSLDAGAPQTQNHTLSQSAIVPKLSNTKTDELDVVAEILKAYCAPNLPTANQFRDDLIAYMTQHATWPYLPETVPQNFMRGHGKHVLNTGYETLRQEWHALESDLMRHGNDTFDLRLKFEIRLNFYQENPAAIPDNIHPIFQKLLYTEKELKKPIIITPPPRTSPSDTHTSTPPTKEVYRKTSLPISAPTSPAPRPKPYISKLLTLGLIVGSFSMLILYLRTKHTVQRQNPTTHIDPKFPLLNEDTVYDFGDKHPLIAKPIEPPTFGMAKKPAPIPTKTHGYGDTIETDSSTQWRDTPPLYTDIVTLLDSPDSDLQEYATFAILPFIPSEDDLLQLTQVTEKLVSVFWDGTPIASKNSYNAFTALARRDSMHIHLAKSLPFVSMLLKLFEFGSHEEITFATKTLRKISAQHLSGKQIFNNAALLHPISHLVEKASDGTTDKDRMALRNLMAQPLDIAYLAQNDVFIDTLIHIAIRDMPHTQWDAILAIYHLSVYDISRNRLSQSLPLIRNLESRLEIGHAAETDVLDALLQQIRLGNPSA